MVNVRVVREDIIEEVVIEWRFEGGEEISFGYVEGSILGRESSLCRGRSIVGEFEG